MRKEDHGMDDAQYANLLKQRKQDKKLRAQWRWGQNVVCMIIGIAVAVFLTHYIVTENQRKGCVANNAFKYELSQLNFGPKDRQIILNTRRDCDKVYPSLIQFVK